MVSYYRADAFVFIFAEFLLMLNALVYAYAGYSWKWPAGWLAAMVIAWWAYRRAHS